MTELGRGGCRCQDLHDAVGGMSCIVLTDMLRRAERDGLITCHLDSERVETKVDPLCGFFRIFRGNTSHLTIAHLEQMAATLQSHMPAR